MASQGEARPSGRARDSPPAGGRAIGQSPTWQTPARRKTRSPELEARPRIGRPATRPSLRAAHPENTCHSTTAKTRIGFFQFMGPAGRCQSAFKDGVGLCDFIGPSPFRQRLRWGVAPSLPAGINKDDSDPHGARIEACYTAPLSGPHDPPLFGGVAIVPPDFPESVRARPMCSR